jgi:hypothetical protein
MQVTVGVAAVRAFIIFMLLKTTRTPLIFAFSSMWLAELVFLRDKLFVRKSRGGFLSEQHC